jgi:hypothetical protein
MSAALRTADGTVVDSAMYSDIKSTVQTLYSAILQPLTPRDAVRPLLRFQLRQFHGADWNRAIRELEETHPIVGLAAHHWKAEQLFQQYISSLTNLAGKRQKKSKGMILFGAYTIL